MNYVLDGYNVIGYADHIQLSDLNKEYALVKWLSQYKVPKTHLTIVFDGQNKDMNFASKEQFEGITMIQTPGGQSADNYIKDVIMEKRSNQNTTIVSSDREIQLYAKKARFNVISSSKFLSNFCQKSPPKSGKKSPKITNRHIDYWLNEFQDNH